MKNVKIADDPINGSHQMQFSWCSEHGLTNKPGPILKGPQWQPLFIRTKKPLKIKTIECGKFGGICSSATCREGHKKLWAT